MSNTNRNLDEANYGTAYFTELQRLGEAIDAGVDEATLALQGWETFRKLQRQLASRVCASSIPQMLPYPSDTRVATLTVQGDPVGFATSRESMSGQIRVVGYGELVYPEEDNRDVDAIRSHTFSILDAGGVSYVSYRHYGSEGSDIRHVSLHAEYAKAISRMAKLLLGESSL